MKIVLVTGGARAGKSRWAESEAARLAGPDVAFVATAEAGDREMADRIAAHRLDRPSSWITFEEPIEVPRTVRDADRPVVILDCLTLWVSNLLLASRERVDLAAAEPAARVQRQVESLLSMTADRTGTLIVVTNEVGLGVVPENPLARTYRDLLGWANARIAGESERVVLLVSGIPVTLVRGR